MLAWRTSSAQDHSTPFPSIESSGQGGSKNTTITWCEREWIIRATAVPEGPGPNQYDAGNVWVDDDGRLHLRILNRQGQWTCAEIFSAERFGFGEYCFTVETELTALDDQAVLGLFVYDNLNCEEMHSEIDIEVTRWGVPGGDNLYHTVQPGWLDPSGTCIPGADPVEYPERKKAWTLMGTNTKHRFRWSPTEVYFESTNTEKEFSFPWRFPVSLKARQGRCQDCSLSNEVLVPSPGPDTRLHINFWLYGEKPPALSGESEVVISSFDFRPHCGPGAGAQGDGPVRMLTDQVEVTQHGQVKTNIVPFDESVFDGAAIGEDELLCIMTIASQWARSVAGEKYANNLNIIYLAVDQHLEGGSCAHFDYVPPIIAYSPKNPLIKNDGYPNFATLFHELGHIVSLNAVGVRGHHLGERRSRASNFLTETTACMFAGFLLRTLIEESESYGLPNELLAKLAAQEVRERVNQMDGSNYWEAGFEYCGGRRHPARTFYNIFNGSECLEGGVDNRSLYTQQAADWMYLKTLRAAEMYRLGNYMEIIRDIKDVAELQMLTFDDEGDEARLAEANTHRASLYAAAVGYTAGDAVRVKGKYQDNGFPVTDELFWYYYHNRREEADTRLWIMEFGSGRVLGVNPQTGNVEAQYGGLKAPVEVEATNDGGCWIADADENRLIRVSASGSMVLDHVTCGINPSRYRETPWPWFYHGGRMTYDRDTGHLWVLDYCMEEEVGYLCCYTEDGTRLRRMEFVNDVKVDDAIAAVQWDPVRGGVWAVGDEVTFVDPHGHVSKPVNDGIEWGATVSPQDGTLWMIHSGSNVRYFPQGKPPRLYSRLGYDDLMDVCADPVSLGCFAVGIFDGVVGRHEVDGSRTVVKTDLPHPLRLVVSQDGVLYVCCVGEIDYAGESGRGTVVQNTGVVLGMSRDGQTVLRLDGLDCPVSISLFEGMQKVE